MGSGIPAVLLTGRGRRPWTPLALTLGLHLLLVLAWLAGARGVERAPPQHASTVVFVQSPAKPVQRAEAAPATPPRSRRPSRAAIPVAAPAIAPSPAAPGAVLDPPAPAPASDTAPAALPGDLLASAKRMAGGADRALRNGSSPITAEPDRKWERFAGLVANARTGVGRDTRLESYTAADGVTIYRKIVGHRVRCYISGSVGGPGPADGRSAGSTACPSGVAWTRH